MLWLFALSFALLVVTVAIRFPYRVVEEALRNTRRLGGTRSKRRVRREVRHAWKLAWRLFGAPAFVLATAFAAMLAFHLYGMPDSTLADLFGESHPETSLHALDLEAWQEAAEAKRRDEAHRKWRQAQGLEPVVEPTLGDQFVQHWPAHFVFLLLSWAFAVVYAFRTTPRAAAKYRNGVRTRAKEYVRQEVTAVLD